MNASTPAAPKAANSRAQDHELLAQRLTQILIQFNQGQALEPAALAEEFGVNLRTIQRDLNERLGFFPIEKSEGAYRLHPSALGKLNLQDLRRFANLAGVQGLFPDLSLNFLRELFDQQVEAAWLVKGPQHENHSDHKAQFAQLEQAILQRQTVGFAYTALPPPPKPMSPWPPTNWSTTAVFGT